MRLFWGYFISGHILKLFQPNFSVHFNMDECLSLHPIFYSVCSSCLEHCRNPAKLAETGIGVLIDFLTVEIRSMCFSIHHAFVWHASSFTVP